MTEQKPKYDKNNPRFRDEFGCVNDLLSGESYVCGESAMIGERDAIDTAIALCELLNSLYNENEQLKELLHESLSSLIWEWSSEIDKELKELEKVMNTGDIDEITKFVENE